MKLALVTPAPPRSRSGNRVTAVRWAKLLRELGHCVVVQQAWDGRACDALIAIHARKSYRSIRRFAQQFPTRPLIVALSGTDLYRDLRHSQQAWRSLALAWRLVVLQPQAIEELPPAVRAKARVVFQSVPRFKNKPPPANGVFEICVLGHLRAVKDPFRAALAARRLPSSSSVRVLQVGRALTDAMRRRAEREAAVNPRYQWLGEIPRAQALRRLARCRLLVLTSKLEGGANVVSEALAADVPVVSSRIGGSVGILGADYPGYFEAGDTIELAKVLHRAETDSAFYALLQAACRRVAPLVDPQRERQAWSELLRELQSEMSHGEERTTISARSARRRGGTGA